MTEYIIDFYSKDPAVTNIIRSERAFNVKTLLEIIEKAVSEKQKFTVCEVKPLIDLSYNYFE